MCRSERFRLELVKRLQKYGSVRYVDGFAKVAKEAAQGAALIADGLVGGRYKGLVDGMELKGAKGTALDHLYIKDADALRRKYLG